MKNLVGLKELRQNVGKYVKRIARGESFIVIKKAKPIFKLMPLHEDGLWEEVIDFTAIRRGGVRINELLKRL